MTHQTNREEAFVVSLLPLLTNGGLGDVVEATFWVVGVTVALIVVFAAAGRWLRRGYDPDRHQPRDDP